MALSVAATLYAGIGINKIAIAYISKNEGLNEVLSPCGICRQSLLELSQRQNKPIEIIMTRADLKSGIIVSDINQLIPFGFGTQFL